MRKLKLCMTVALVLGVSASAFAIPLDFSVSPGEVRLKYSNWDMGTTYLDPTEWPDDGSPVVMDGLTQMAFPGVPATPPAATAAALAGADELFYSADGASSYYLDRGVTPATDAWFDAAGSAIAKPSGLEDAWFIFKLSSIEDGWFGSTGQSYSTSSSALDIVGIAYGLQDVGIGSAGSILSAGYTIELWVQPEGSFNELLGTSGRTSATSYTGIGTPGGVGGAELLWKMNSIGDANAGLPGFGLETFTGPAAPGYEHIASITGRSDMYLDSNSGRWADGNFGNGEIVESEFTDFYGGGMVTADGHVKSSVLDYVDDGNALTPDNWMFISEDPVRLTYAVPEPATALCALAALAGLAGYLRKRRIG